MTARKLFVKFILFDLGSARDTLVRVLFAEQGRKGSSPEVYS
jgi:hypothetical protein